MDLTGISLFASSGIGDLGVRAAGINVLLASELLRFGSPVVVGS